MKQIAVVGSDSKVGSDSDLPDEILKIAGNIGKGIANNGCILVCGGRGGVMESACRGAKEVGGITVGILPGLNKEDSNPYVDVVITTGMGYARNSLVVSCADAVIAIAGRTGTLSEIALALNFGKPVVLVEGTGGISESIYEVLEEKVHKASPKDAVKLALELIG